MSARIERLLDLLIRYVELKVSEEEYRRSGYTSLRHWTEEKEKSL